MAEIRPFAGIRPEKGKAADIAALPYDVYSRKEAAAFVREHPHSFLRIDRAETQFPPDADMYGEYVYEKARGLLWGMVEDGSLRREDCRCYYLYELTMEGRTQNGIVACASVDDYLSGVIRRHENTREEKERDRVRHVERCGAQTGPVFLAYRADRTLREITQAVKKQDAEYDFVAEDGVRHRVFVIRDTAVVAAIRTAFAGIGTVYIADGHHRAASAVEVARRRRMAHPGYSGEEEFNYFLSVLFPDEELRILDYNRVVRDLNGNEPEIFLEEVRKRFDVTACPVDAREVRPGERGCFSMYLNERWYLCRIRQKDQSCGDPVRDLDVSVLQERLLAPVLGILDPKTDSRIDFVGGIRGTGELVRRCHTGCAVAFAMYPTSADELFAVADAGLLMPPKSTWFEPKLRSGLFIHEI